VRLSEREAGSPAGVILSVLCEGSGSHPRNLRCSGVDSHPNRCKIDYLARSYLWSVGGDGSIYITSPPRASFERERASREKVLGRLLRGQAERKQADELARKSSNLKWRNALLGVCGNDCPCGRPAVF